MSRFRWIQGIWNLNNKKMKFFYFRTTQKLLALTGWYRYTIHHFFKPEIHGQFVILNEFRIFEVWLGFENEKVFAGAASKNFVTWNMILRLIGSRFLRMTGSNSTNLVITLNFRVYLLRWVGNYKNHMNHALISSNLYRV